jgi:hypothetical protein
MKTRYKTGNYTYRQTKEVIEMVNNNCDVANESRIPMMFGYDSTGWWIECLYKEDEPRLEKYLNFIYGLA